MVGKIGVIISPEIILYLDELINQLSHKKYFGFIDSSDK
jgi:hypothetical protein